MANDKILNVEVLNFSKPANRHIALSPYRDDGRRIFDGSVQPKAGHTAGSTPADSPSHSTGLLKPVRQFVAWFRHRRQVRRDIMKLLALDDRLLADIGLSRGEILYAAAQHGRLPERSNQRG